MVLSERTQPNLHTLTAKLIFNPSAGATRERPVEILDVLREMQAWEIIPEVFIVEEDCDLTAAIEDALSRGIEMFVVCGGDGTIANVAAILADTDATLGIVSTGTRNNIALSLGLPPELPQAIGLLRTGRRILVDMGLAIVHGPAAEASAIDASATDASATEGEERATLFLEVCSVGLGSALFPSIDDVQHGDLTRIGDFLTTLVTSPPAEIHLVLDDEQDVRALGHMVLISNMPYTGRNYQMGSAVAFDDGLLDVLFFADLTKLDLIGYALTGVGADKPEDPRILRYRVRQIEIDTQPDMQVMADGNALGEGKVQIKVQPHRLAVMVGEPTPEVPSNPDENSEG